MILREIFGKKTLMFVVFSCSSQLQPACDRGLMALCAFGLVSGDATLAGAALGELMNRENGKSGYAENKWGERGREGRERNFRNTSAVEQQ